VKKVAVLIFLAMLAGFGIPGHGFSQADFYQGKTINVVYGGGPGGTVSHRFRAPQTHTGQTHLRHRIHAGRRIPQGWQLHLQGPAGRADHGSYALELCAGGRARLERGSL